MPRVINVDKHQTIGAMEALNAGGSHPEPRRFTAGAKYLNNVFEQDHRTGKSGIGWRKGYGRSLLPCGRCKASRQWT